MAWFETRVRRNGPRYTGVYRDTNGRKRSAGTFDSSRQALRAARKAEGRVEDGTWIDPADGRISFGAYVEHHWWPMLALEVSTLAAYRSYLDAHFLPALGDLPMSSILPSTVQAWVTQVRNEGRLSARSIVKYHTMLHGLFRQAVVDRVIAHNPCAQTRLPKVPKARVVARKRRVVTPAEFDRIIDALPQQHLAVILTDIETGLRWGELIALRPCDLDEAACTITVQRVIVEVSKNNSPTGQRFIVKDYPKDDEPRILKISRSLTDLLVLRGSWLNLAPGDLLFATSRRTPLSRSNFRQRVWLPAVEAAGLDFPVRVQDLRHAHASWALKGGADLMAVKERLGHGQVSTTQNYLHALADADSEALDAFTRVRRRTA